jgi:5-formyltetrahydrofolate cyclo-ligase
MNESNSDTPRMPSSPVCYAAEGEIDPQQMIDLARWRKSERMRLRADRLSIPSEKRAALTEMLTTQLEILLSDHNLQGTVVSGYWPIKGELDLRPWLADLYRRGAVIALPVVERPAAPLVFRRWHPGMEMERGFWNIPVPPASAEPLFPRISLAPLVGWDSEGFRLGYGGGYFDRTLAALHPRAWVIGVGLQGAQISTIFPQPHDVRMGSIVTEMGTQYDRRTDGRE